MPIRTVAAAVFVGMLAACAGSQPPATTPAVTKPAPVEAPPPLPLASALPLAEWLPAGAVLAARIDIVALQKAGPLPALLEAWLGEQSVLVEGARRVHAGVEPTAAGERVVLVVEAEQAPPSSATASWTQIARDAWVGCVRACDGYTLARTAPARASDVRGLLAASAAPPSDPAGEAVGQELLVVQVGELLDESAPAKAALRERLLDTQVGVASEMRDGTLRMTQASNVLTTELHASFTSRGVASSASLLTRGAVFEAADALEAVGLTREADLLYAVSMSLGEDDMTAKLSVPLDAVPALALAWLKARATGETLE
jgi:hypothetical protein